MAEQYLNADENNSTDPGGHLGGKQIQRIGLGGSCHWCTEAIFMSLKGVTAVQQGWIASEHEHQSWSEAVIVDFDVSNLSLSVLIAVHLATHSCTSLHSMRSKYRSAVYCFSAQQSTEVADIISSLQSGYESKIITNVIPLKKFRLNVEQYLNYYYADPAKPFCENVINPKLRQLLTEFGDMVDKAKLQTTGFAHLSQK